MKITRYTRFWIATIPALVSSSALAETITGQASVVDGDTLEIHGQRIRLSGIDAPESDQLCRGDDSLQYRCGAILPERVGLIPSWEAVRQRSRMHPEFAERYHAVMEERRAARGGVHLRRPHKPSQIMHPRAVTGDLVAAVDAAIPRWVDPVERDDIRSDVVMAVLSGEIGPAEIPAYTREITRGFDRQKNDTRRSVDRMVGDEGGTTFLDLETTHHFTFEDAI